MAIPVPRQSEPSAAGFGKLDHLKFSMGRSRRLTRICLVRLLSLLDAPANLFNVFADVVVAQLLLLHALGCRTPVAPLLLGALGDDLLEVGNDPLLNRSCGDVRNQQHIPLVVDHPPTPLCCNPIHKKKQGLNEAHDSSLCQKAEGPEQLGLGWGGKENVPMRSVPTHFTSRKQKGKSKTLSPRYTPSADHPYSLESFLSRPLKESDSSAFAPPDWDLFDQDQLKFRFCVLENSLVVVLDVVVLHAREPRTNGVEADPAGILAAFPSVAVCTVLAEGSDLEVVLVASVASLGRGELLGAKGGRPSTGGLNARSMFVVPIAIVLVPESARAWLEPIRDRAAWENSPRDALVEKGAAGCGVRCSALAGAMGNSAFRSTRECPAAWSGDLRRWGRAPESVEGFEGRGG